MGTRRIGKTEFTNVNALLLIGTVFAIVFLYFIYKNAFHNGESLISIMIFPLIFGIVFENFRLGVDWKTLSLKILGALLFSVFAFMPGKRENPYVYENHMELWPYWFVFFFVLISVIYHDKKIIPKLTEGITLIQSISIIYWVLDMGLFDQKNWFTNITMIIGLVLCTFSFTHAFTSLKLTRNARLFLSIWSSIIMIVFAADHIYRVFHYTKTGEVEYLDVGLNALQHFLLGVSLIYIFQNAMMILEYLPSRNRFYNKVHLAEIKQMNKTHIERYSFTQVSIADSLFALVFTALLYYSNYKFLLMPRHTMIWLLFWTLPFFIWFSNELKNKIKNYRQQSL